jgi:acetyl esterase
VIVARLADLDQDALFAPHAARSDEMQALWEWMRAQDAGLPDPTTLPPTTGRALADALTVRLRGEWGAQRVVYETIASVGGAPLGLKVVAPETTAKGTILYLHGGGWCFGSVETHDATLRDLGRETGCVVVAVDYRLAPEHPYPAGLDDCAAAWAWLRAAIADGRFPARVAFAGDSAGANLAMALALREQARSAPSADALILLYGAFGADFETRSYRRFSEGYGLTRQRMINFFRWYAPTPDLADPCLVPLVASDAALALLPPIYLNAASLDPLLSDTLALVARLEGIGHPHRFALHRGLHHGFHTMSARLAQAREAARLVGAWMARGG